jgi:hypothetical protein
LLIQYRHLCAFDLTSYGAALQMINQFVDDEGVKVFEVSPCGAAATLILLSKEVSVLQLLKAEAQKLFTDSISASVLIENLHADLLPVYLSQNKPILKKSLLVFENSFLSPLLQFADEILKKNISVVDFRLIRTFPVNAILTLTADSANALQTQMAPSFKTTVIENIQPALRSFYEIR